MDKVTFPARFLLKEGVIWCMMDPRLEAQMPVICNVWHSVTGTWPTVTSARDGTHGQNSLHYEGRALDFRTWNISKQNLLTIRAKLLAVLEPRGGWDIVLEKDHIHAELDRRADNLPAAQVLQ